MMEASPETLTLTGFQAALRTQFGVRHESLPEVELVLMEARAVRPAGTDQPGRCFSLLFHGPPEPFLPQGLYGFRHDALGAFDLFIVPVGRDETHFHYEAVFNRAPVEP